MSADIASKLKADGASEGAPLFVINLCASTSPMALTHPNTPELKRFTFFVSRQREDGRERFRLHMGYFASQEEAESLLSAVRDVYPAAWAGPAPTSGMPKRARVSAVPPLVVAAPTAVAEPRAAAPAGASAAVAAPVNAAPAAVSPAPAAPAPAAKSPPVLDTMSNVRDVLAQLDGPTAHTAAKAAQRPAGVIPVAAPATAPVTASVSVPVRTAATAVAPPAAPAPAAARPVVPAPATAAAAAPSGAPVRPAKEAAIPQAPATTSGAPADAPVPPASKVLDASQTLQVLESTSAVPVASVMMDDEVVETSDVRIVTPEDTQTLRDIKLDAQNNAPPTFAVQLVWAVTPIDVSALPHLAIFDAYTLYNVEGSRQGRKWYGLRLGFFSDPHSATQVAHYVRADYQSVAVVPVALKERDHAKGGVAAVAPRLGDAGAPLKPQAEVKLQAQGLDGFELLKDDRPPPEKRDVDDMQAPAAGAQAQKLARERIAAAVNGSKPAAVVPKGKVPVAMPVAAQAPGKTAGKPAGKPTGKRVVVRKRPDAPVRAAPGAPQPLESTLEILGASTLTIDESREIVNDSAVRKPIEKKSGSRFAKLLNRLSGG